MKIAELPFDPAHPNMEINRDGVWVKKNHDNNTYTVWTRAEKREDLDLVTAQAVLYAFVGEGS